jgi:hypothetical protein
MADQFLTPGWYLQPGGWPYWIANGLAAFAAPRNDAWTQNLPSSDSKGGILGTLAEPTAPAVCLKPKQGRNLPSPVFASSIPIGDQDRALTKASRVLSAPMNRMPNRRKRACASWRLRSRQ